MKLKETMSKNKLLAIEIILLSGIIALKLIPSKASLFIQKHAEFDTLIKYFGFIIIINLIARIVKYIYSKGNQIPLNRQSNVYFGIDNIARVLIGLGFIVTIFGLFGIDFKSLLTSLSIVAASIAIISREFIYDFLIGIFFFF